MSTPDLDEQRGSPDVEEQLKEGSIHVATSSPPQSSSSTLSVANVSLEATEEEIGSVFSRLMRERGEREKERERERERERCLFYSFTAMLELLYWMNADQWCWCMNRSRFHHLLPFSLIPLLDAAALDL